MTSFRIALRQPRDGFTLVELLVVVAIIALLIAILLPALGKSMAQSRRATCLSNLRQFGQCYAMYVADNKGQNFPYDTSNGGYWVPLLRPGYTQNDRLMLCPDALEPAIAPTSSTGITGSAFTAWTKYVSGNPVGSYGLNGHMYRYDTIGWGGTGDPARNFGGSPPQAGRVPLVADSIWPNGWPKHTDPVPSNLFAHDKGNHMGRFCIARHGKAVNIVFVDGHCDTVPLAELWQLKWSPLFEPTVVSIP